MELERLFIEMEHDLKHEILCMSCSPELADDIYQNAYLRIARYKEEGRDFYGNERSKKSMLKLMVRNMVIDEKRKADRSKISYTDKGFMMIDEQNAEKEMILEEGQRDQSEINKRLRKAFKKMNHDTYMTYQLRMKGYKFKEIAYLTDTGINTALGRMRYAILKIEDELMCDDK